jgi:hypothetical protein
LYFFSYLDLNELKNILEKCIKLPEYTVREKCAKIVCLCKSDKNIYILREKLEKDENYYVKKALEY